MTWTERQWHLLFELLDQGWPGELSEGQADAYRTLLDGTDPEIVVAGLRRLLHRGQRFRPSAAELLGAANHDPSRPTFDEAYHLIFSEGGVLRARPTERRWGDEAERRRLYRDAAREHARGLHPLIGAFVERQGIDRLRDMPVDDPDQAHWRRQELRTSWIAHVEAFEGREIAVLASGEGHDGLRRLDPLTGLDAPRPQLQPTTGDR